MVSSPKSSAFIWDNIEKVAYVSFKGKHVNIIVRDVVKETKVSIQRERVLVQKADEIENLSSIKQKRAYFKPYFTDKFINKIITQNGIGETNSEFKNVGSYVDYNDNGKVTIYQSDERYEDLTIYTRILYLVKEDGVYKIDDIYTKESEYLIR